MSPNTMSSRNTWVVVITLLIALILTLLPLPHLLEVIRPEFLTLVLIYWCLAIPERIGVTVGWCVGIILDVTHGALLGQHALALALIAFVVVQLHKRIRLFPIWQQAITVMLMVMFSQLVSVWISGIIERPSGGLAGWLPVVSSMLIWPPLFLLLRRIRRFYRVR